MERSQSKLEFHYTNEFGNTTITKEDFEVDVLEAAGENTFEYIVERFKAFLKFAQFSEKMVDSIQYLDEEK